MPVYGYLQEEVSRRPPIRSRLSLPGDHLVRIVVTVPREASEELKAALEDSDE